MRQSLKTIYQKYFPEIISGVLLGVAFNTILLVFGILNATDQRNKIDEKTTVKLDSISVGQKEMQSDLTAQSDSITHSLMLKLDKINQK